MDDEQLIIIARILDIADSVTTVGALIWMILELRMLSRMLLDAVLEDWREQAKREQGVKPN